MQSSSMALIESQGDDAEATRNMNPSSRSIEMPAEASLASGGAPSRSQVNETTNAANPDMASQSRSQRRSIHRAAYLQARQQEHPVNCVSNQNILELADELRSISLASTTSPAATTPSTSYPSSFGNFTNTSRSAPRASQQRPRPESAPMHVHPTRANTPASGMNRTITTGPIPPPSGRTWRRNERDASRPFINLLRRPVPTTDYMKQSQISPKRQDIARPLLIIMDLNNCILDRGKNKGSHGHLRPFLQEFIDYCSESHIMMVWSSASPSNVESMSARAFADKSKHLAAVWDRSTLRLTKEQSELRVQVYKQLQWVWEDEHITKSHPYALSGGRWNQTNTVLIDDSLEKAAAQPHNHILVPEYKKENEKQELERKVLAKVVGYLKEAAHYEDVSSFIRTKGFPDWMAGASMSDGTVKSNGA